MQQDCWLVEFTQILRDVSYLVGISKLASLSSLKAICSGVEPSTLLTPRSGIESNWNWVIRSNPDRVGKQKISKKKAVDRGCLK